MRKIIQNIKSLLYQYSLFRVLRWLLIESNRSSAFQYSPEMFKEYGCGILLDDNVNINRPDRVILKDNCVIHSGAIINSQGGLILGNYSAIGYNATIFTLEHQFRGARAIPFDDNVILKPVVIGDFVIMGINVSIFPGIEIGEGAILGMGSVIMKDVPASAIVMGNPAEIIGHRNREHFEKLKKNKMFQYQIVRKYKENVLSVHLKRRGNVYEQFGL